MTDLRSGRADCFVSSECCRADWSARTVEAEFWRGFYDDRPLVNSVFSSPCELKHIFAKHGHTVIPVRLIHQTRTSPLNLTKFHLGSLLIVVNLIFLSCKANILMIHWKVSSLSHLYSINTQVCMVYIGTKVEHYKHDSLIATFRVVN